jgi:hypothetical protein
LVLRVAAVVLQALQLGEEGPFPLPLPVCLPPDGGEGVLELAVEDREVGNDSFVVVKRGFLGAESFLEGAEGEGELFAGADGFSVLLGGSLRIGLQLANGLDEFGPLGLPAFDLRFQ